MEGEAPVAGLKIPVTITMPIPIPSTIKDISKLVILHYTTTGNYELITPKVDMTLRTMTFTITKFSTFAFAEDHTVPQQNANGGSVGVTVVSGNAQTSNISDAEPAKARDKAVTVQTITGTNKVLLDNYLESIHISSSNLKDVSVYETDKGFADGFIKTLTETNTILVSPDNSIAMYLGGWTFINREMAAAITESGKTVRLVFVVKNTYYLVTIPAGVDFTQYLDEDGFAGPLYIASKVGSAEIMTK